MSEHPMTKLLRLYRFNAKSLSQALGVAWDTGKKRINQPDTITVGEIKKLIKYGVSLQQIVEAIKNDEEDSGD